MIFKIKEASVFTINRLAKSQIYRIFPIICWSIAVCGCSATTAIGPERVFTVEEQVAGLRSLQSTAPTNVQDRNTLITERMFAMDLEYTTYFAKLTKERQLASVGGDLAILGLTATTTIVPVAATKTIISAVSTAVAGAKTDIDQDVYVSQTIQILQSQMESSRLLIRNRIVANLTLTMDKYTAWQGFSDLEDYYRAGTIAGALESLAAATGSNSQQAKNATNGTTQSGIAVNPSATTGTTSAGAKAHAVKAP
jgi:hypothetical protein